MKILIVEDQPELVEDLSSFLTGRGYQCDTATSFLEGEDRLALYEYEVVILDVGLPGGSGLKLLKQLKERKLPTAVLILSAKDSLDDKLAGLDLGADDYLTKPFHMAELNARIHALIRRNRGKGFDELNFESLKIDLGAHSALAGKQALNLTQKEYQLLEYFMLNPGRVLSKQDLAEHLWGEAYEMVDNYDFLYVHIKNLRKKIKEAIGHDYLRTIYGLGYKLEAT